MAALLYQYSATIAEAPRLQVEAGSLVIVRDVGVTGRLYGQGTGPLVIRR